MIHRYTVIGNPIAHSLSPKIHSLFAEQTQRTIDYTRTLSTEETFVKDVQTFIDARGRGMNVTVPFKQTILPMCTSLSPAATLANAVNTVRFLEDGTIHGHNTDGSGLLIDLIENHGLSLEDSEILIAGAGGATRGILGPLLDRNPLGIVVANRNVDKARQLAKTFSSCGSVEACSYAEIPKQAFKLIINATSMSLNAERPDIPTECINAETVSYDLMYGNDTPFMTWSQENGARKVLNGIGMLLEQAADAFFIWEEVRPKTRLILPRLYE